MMNQEECGHLFCKCRTQRAALAHLTSHKVWNSCLFPGESGMRRLTHLHARSDLHHQASAWHFLRVHFFKKKKKKSSIESLLAQSDWTSAPDHTVLPVLQSVHLWVWGPLMLSFNLFSSSCCVVLPAVVFPYICF